MNQRPRRLITVHPERMLTVTLRYPTQDVQVNAIGCRYIATTVATMGHPVVAIEVIEDPLNPTPIVPYQCYAEMLSVIALPDNYLIQVRPYFLYPPPPSEPSSDPPLDEWGRVRKPRDGFG
ncbi:MAG: hypothetical protein ACRELB_13490 [Polyangiaceae bacterium]